jgi:hypothetical protein
MAGRGGLKSVCSTELGCWKEAKGSKIWGYNSGWRKWLNAKIWSWGDCIMGWLQTGVLRSNVEWNGSLDLWKFILWLLFFGSCKAAMPSMSFEIQCWSTSEPSSAYLYYIQTSKSFNKSTVIHDYLEKNQTNQVIILLNVINFVY